VYDGLHHNLYSPEDTDKAIAHFVHLVTEG
jgi:hypothetical protein